MKYYCARVETELTIDGNIHKKEWESARAAELVETVTGSRPRQETTARLLWNDRFLYVGFSCKDDFINATLTQYNDKLYDEEVVEIFIDDNRDKKTYIELEVNPLNALLHFQIHNNLNGSFLKFARVEKTVETAVIHDKEKGIWDVEMAIPLSEFVTAEHNPPRKGDTWLMNLYRIDRPEDGNDEYSAWSPTGAINYHLPEKFGELIFD